MSALGTVVRSGVGRRRVQTVVIALVAMIAVAAAVLGGSLMVASRAPFDRAFEQQRGAHLTAQFDETLVSAAQLSTSAEASGVSAAAGPFQTAVVTLVDAHGRGLPAMTVAGRDAASGPVDAVTLIEGRWVTAVGEIVLYTDGREDRPRPNLGDVLTLADIAGTPSLTVVGFARSVSETAGGWVAPDELASWTGTGLAVGYQMLYRFTAADTAAEVSAGRAAVVASVPADSMTGARSWLTTRTDSAGNIILFVPFLIAFGVLGLLMAVLIVGNVIAGAVSTGTRRIGILKALGFTPNQVVRAYTVQALVPAAVGAALGVVAGTLLTIPVLAQTNSVFGTSDSGVTPWLDAAVLAGALALVLATAWSAASRAGRLRTVDVLAVGRTPRPGRGQWATRLAGRLPLPRSITLGLAHPFARPLRSATIVAAIAFGAAAATFTVGLGASLNQAQASENHGDVVIHPGAMIVGPPAAGSGGGESGPGGPGGEGGPGPGAEPTPPDPVVVVAAITALTGTNGYSGVAQTEVSVPGLTEGVETLALTGDNSSYGYEMTAGSWFDQPDEIVVAKPFLTATDTQVGDTIVLTAHGEEIPVRIVGEVFNLESNGMQILTAAETLATAEPDLAAMEYNITLEPGTDPAAYVETLNTALASTGVIAEVPETDTAEVILVINTLTTLLALMLITVAGLGVLNMVVLETRERVHDLGVHKALGMTPRQTISMVIASVVVTGLVGGAIGAPIGVLLQKVVMGEMGRSINVTLPDSVINVYQPAELLLFGLGGLVIAVVGALLPAGWAARTRTATALRTE